MLGIRFTVVTDCRALVFLNLHKTTKPQVARWYELLQEYDFDILYKPGTRMAHVDALSRVEITESIPSVLVEETIGQRLDVCVSLSTHERVQLMQQADFQMRKLISLLQRAVELTPHENNLISNYELANGLLYRKYKGNKLLAVPKSMRKGIVIAAHDLGGNFSVERIIDKITRDYWFSALRRYIRQHIRMCIDCLVHKKPFYRC